MNDNKLSARKILFLKRFSKFLIIFSIIAYSIFSIMDFAVAVRISQPVSFSLLLSAALLLMYANRLCNKPYAHVLMVFILAIFTFASSYGVAFFDTEYVYYIYSLRVVFIVCFFILARYIIMQKPIKNILLIYFFVGTFSTALSGVATDYVFEIYFFNLDDFETFLVSVAINLVLLFPFFVSLFIILKHSLFGEIIKELKTVSPLEKLNRDFANRHESKTVSSLEELNLEFANRHESQTISSLEELNREFANRHISYTQYSLLKSIMEGTEETTYPPENQF